MTARAIQFLGIAPGLDCPVHRSRAFHPEQGKSANVRGVGPVRSLELSMAGPSSVHSFATYVQIQG